jgi:dUTP pyrophosphatase
MTMPPLIPLAMIQLPHAHGLPLPVYATDDSAGMDLIAAFAQDQTLTLASGERGLIPTGLIMEIPTGFEGQVRPRSGLALKHGITVLNSPGTIDADYRGEVKVILINHGQEPFVVERGMRIAQLIIAPVTRVQVQETSDVSSSARGAGGFGSTGVSS